MKRIIFIGPCGGNSVPYHGASFKNSLIVKRLRELHVPVEVIDTENWRHDPKVLWHLARRVIHHHDSNFVVSASRHSAYRLLSFLKAMKVKDPVHYWVIGGRLAEDIQSGQFAAKTLGNLASVVVETNSMKSKLEALGLDNVMVIPNFKELPKFPIIPLAPHPVIRFIFLSRIDEAKGCDLIFKASEILRERGYAGRFSVDFYGRIEKYYEPRFLSQIVKNDNVHYRGFLNMTRPDSYERLAEYDCMLFPSVWESEGFAGTLIDAMVAGLPVIASDWMSISEIVENGFTGLLIHPDDEVSLADAMASVIDGDVNLSKMKEECLRRAPAYNIRTVITPESVSFLTHGLEL